jgi:tRNA uridine 5-carboxymethylaminomethyl modification enzyme
VEKQIKQIEKMKKMLKMKIPENFDYASVPGLSNEVIEKLKTFNPPTLFNASEVSGITPAAIDVLHLYINLRGKQ